MYPIEHPFTCPFCWQTITMILEPTAEPQTYVEDCEVCCRPIQITYRTEGETIADFSAEPAQDAY